MQDRLNKLLRDIRKRNRRTVSEIVKQIVVYVPDLAPTTLSVGTIPSFEGTHPSPSAYKKAVMGIEPYRSIFIHYINLISPNEEEFQEIIDNVKISNGNFSWIINYPVSYNLKLRGKLVRDNIPKIVQDDKERTPQFYRISGQEYFEGLKHKLVEETREFIKSESIEELVDIYEVVKAIQEYLDIRQDEVEKLRVKKALERGSFKEGFFLLDKK